MKGANISKLIREPSSALRFIKHQSRDATLHFLQWSGIAGVLQEAIVREPYIHGDSSRVSTGENTSLEAGVWLNTRSGSIEIGDKVMIGRNVQLITGTHDFNKTGRERIETVPTEGRDIIIHDGAWISWGVDVIGPCEIGENTVISAGSVVIDDCEANAIYAGNPAKKVSEIDIE